MKSSFLKSGPRAVFKAIIAATIVLAASASSEAVPLWYPIQPIPQGGSLYSVDCSLYECSAVGAAGANLVVRAGSNGLIASSDPYSRAYLYANTFGNNEFLAIASGNYQDPYAYILNSPNGYVWAPTGGKIAINNANHLIRDVIWTGTKYVATGYTLSYFFTWFPFSINFTSTPIIATSWDGVSWSTPVAGPTYNTIRGFNGIASNPSGKVIVAVGGTTGVADIYTSTNSGGAFSAQTSPVAEQLNGVIWDNIGSQFVAVGDNGTILTSINGTTWTNHSPPGVTYILNSVASKAGLLVAVGNGIALSSTNNGTSWAYALGVTDNLYDVTWDGSEMLAVGDGGAIVVSYDGFLWFSWDYAEPLAPTYYDVTTDGTNTVAVGNQGTLDLSTDGGITWTKKGTDPAEFFQGIDWVPSLGLFVAVGSSGVVNTSPNGVGWTNRTSGTTTSFSSVAHVSNGSGTKVVATGGYGIYSSPDGVTWTPQTDPYSVYKYAVAGSDTAGFVAVGSSNQIIYSPAGASQGVNWYSATIPVTVPSSATWHDVYWYPLYSIFIAVGTDGSKGLLIWSNNGSSWVDNINLGNQRPQSAFYGVGGQSRVYAVGTEGSVFESIDGVAWSQVNMPTSATLQAVAETNAVTGEAVAVGTGSTIIAKLIDSQPPQQIVAPADLTIEAVNATPIPISDPQIQGWLKQFYATDDRDHIIFHILNNAPASFAPNTTTPIGFWVSDKAGNQLGNSGAPAITVNVITQDRQAPVVTAPANITIPSVAGVLGTTNTDPYVVAFLAGATATDNVDGTITSISNDAPAIFPIGTTTVTFSASDSAAVPNIGTASATVTVWDAQPPTINLPVPNHYIIAATGPADVPFSDPYVQQYINAATAYDNWDPGLLTVYSNQPVFPVGTQVFIDFYAYDAYGNIGMNSPNSASITVMDLDGPTITVPADISVLATSALGTDISNALIQTFLNGATAVDNVDPLVNVTYYAPAVFPIGKTRVDFVATDVTGNTSSNYAYVTVKSGTGGTINPSGCTLQPEAPFDPILLAILAGLAVVSLRRRRFR